MVKNIEVLRKIAVKEQRCCKTEYGLMQYTCWLRGCNWINVVLLLEGRINGCETRGWPRRNWIMTTDMYEVPDAVPPIHAVSSHVATDKDPFK